MKIEWYCFETNHDKGPLDEIGGPVKDADYRSAISKKVVIESPQQSATYADSILQSMYIGQ